MPLRIFISSVQQEFAGERQALRDYVRGDPLLRRCFEVFLFEDLPAADRRADQVYLDEVAACDLYLTRYIKRMGTGTGDMIRRSQEAGLREPDFAIRDGFVTTIWRPTQKPSEKTTQEPSEKTSEKRAGKTVAAIRLAMRENPHITIAELAEQLERSTRAIEMQIAKMQEQQLIRRVGPDKGGYWEVIE